MLLIDAGNCLKLNSSLGHALVPGSRLVKSFEAFWRFFAMAFQDPPSRGTAGPGIQCEMKLQQNRHNIRTRESTKGHDTAKITCPCTTRTHLQVERARIEHTQSKVCSSLSVCSDTCKVGIPSCSSA